MSPIVAVVIALVVLVLVLVVASRSRHSTDGVDSFRRQIDALSPEARRPVIDQMYSDDSRNDSRNDSRIDPRIDPRPAEADSSDKPGESADDDASDQDGAHGA